ncbi:MAG TPA: tRNA dihydrouridine synthase DusB [Anaeromyxobacteraceae bacterium]|nr:tRNA dihydrouridine synthase DusB [Anaeromyxobacteraceae bacterium]
MKIGPYHFEGRFFLAPLAGVSDRPFRKICRDHGASFSYTEMVSAHGLIHGNEQTERYLDRDPEEVPFAVQLFGAEPAVLARGAEVAVERGAALIDINMACPAKKVCRTGAGAALAREPERVRAAVEAVRAATGVPVSVKIRAGWDEGTVNCVEVAQAAEAGGASAVALHGRTRAQFYQGRARWELIGAVKRALRVPVLGSGDVFSADDALRMVEQTGCDGVLVARGACGNPWIFRELAVAERGEVRPRPPSREEWMKVVLRHLDLQIEQGHRENPSGDDIAVEHRALRELRKHLIWYTRGHRGGVRFRRDAARLKTADDARRLIDLHFKALGDGLAIDFSLAAGDAEELSRDDGDLT